MLVQRFNFGSASWLLILFPVSVIAQFNIPMTNPLVVGQAPAAIAVGNLNGDTFPDLAVANKTSAIGTVSIFWGTGAGGFLPAYTLTAGTRPTAIVIADFNQDGFQDMAVANQGDATVSVYINDGTGVLKFLKTYPTGSSPVALAAGDINGDGYPDLAVANSESNNVTVLLWNNAQTTFSPAQNAPAGNGPRSIVAGNFRGTGVADLLVANQLDNTVTILFNNGDKTGSFTPSPTSPIPVGTAPYSLTAADFNLDGNLDFALANLGSNNVSVMLGNGAGGFALASGSPIAVKTAPAAIAVSDFNEDGFLDLAVVNSGSNSVSILLGNGSGGFTPGQGSPFPTGNMPMSIAAADFNSDFLPDLAIANYADGTATILLNGSVGAPAMVSAASFTAAGGVAPGSMASIFNIAAMPSAGNTCSPLVTVTDFSGAKSTATVTYFGGTQTNGGQINMIVPVYAAIGSATFSAAPQVSASAGAPCAPSPTGISQKGAVTINSVAPTLFSANESGKGVASGQFYTDLLTAPPQSLYTCTPLPCTAVPFSVTKGSAALVLYGTGIRNRGSSAVTVNIGGLPFTAFYAGPLPGQPGVDGVDQVSVSLPPSLAGAGTVLVTVSIGSAMSNPVTITILPAS
jgi:uncharacterized protein (TIGR03437 family)